MGYGLRHDNGAGLATVAGYSSVIFNRPCARPQRGERNMPMRLAQILKYNEEDLAATWAVFEWLRGKGAAAQVPAGRP